MDPGQKNLTWVGSGQFFVARVGLGQPSLAWGWVRKISPKNIKSKNLFGLGQRRDGLLFTLDQNYARVGL